MSVQIRPPHPGDGPGMARVWLGAGAYYADLDPALAVPFYERHGYQRRSILFQKPLS
ncbi:MAG: hypothetical protein ACRDPD_34660 [Streptosporangiaceae bacterium]